MNCKQVMSLALCLGVAFFLLTGSAMASGTTKLNPAVTPSLPVSTYASELTITPPVGPPAGNVYKLVSNATYDSNVYRAMTVARTTAQNFLVVVTLGNGATFATGTLPVGGDVTILAGTGGTGAATFTLAAGGTNGATSATFLSNISASFTGFPTVMIAAGTSGWTIRDVSNQLATGPIAVTVQTFDAADGTQIDGGGTDTINLARASSAVVIPPGPPSQALVPTTAVVDVATNRQNFLATAPDTLTQDKGATLGIGYATPVPLALAGTPFALAATDKVRLTFTSSNDFSGLTVGTGPLTGQTTGIKFGAVGFEINSTGTGTTRTIDISGTDANNFNTGSQPFTFTIDGTTVLPTRVISVAVDLILAVGGSTVNGGTRNIQAASTVTTWTFNGSVLVANWVNGNTNFFKSRIYLWNSSSTTGLVTVRVFTQPLVDGGTITSTELTTPGSPLSMGSLAGNSGMNIRLFEDILGPAGLNIAPYTANGGNVIVEITIRANNVRGTCQVFNNDATVTFGQTPLQVVQ